MRECSDDFPPGSRRRRRDAEAEPPATARRVRPRSYRQEIRLGGTRSRHGTWVCPPRSGTRRLPSRFRRSSSHGVGAVCVRCARKCAPAAVRLGAKRVCRRNAMASVGGAAHREPGLVASPHTHPGSADHGLPRDAVAGALPGPLRRPTVVARSADTGPRRMRNRARSPRPRGTDSARPRRTTARVLLSRCSTRPVRAIARPC
jgi:hypothetical protein